MGRRGSCIAWMGVLLVASACGKQSGELLDSIEPGGDTPAAVSATDGIPDGGTSDGGTGQPTSARCAPTAGGPYWLAEREHVQFTASCSTGHAGAEVRFELVDLPRGATFDPVTGAFAWSPEVDQAGVYTLTVRETSTGESGFVKVGVADAFDRSDNKPVNPDTYTEEYGIPVMHLSYTNTMSSSAYIPATLVYRGHHYDIQAKYRGATSMDFPKRSYTFEFSDADEFNDPLVGFGNRDKLALITSFNDNSYVRSRLAFELWRRLDSQNLKVKTFPVVMYRNGRYWGVYTAAERIDSDLMRRAGLNPDGNLYKAFHADANFDLYMSTGEQKWALWQGYEKKEGTPAEGEPHAKDDIADLTGFVISATHDEFRTGLGQRVVLRDYENWWIFVSMILATDSGGKNAYHYRDAAANGPFRYIPWDLDASCGQDWDTRRTSPYWRKTFAVENNMFRRMLADSAMVDPVRARYTHLLQNELSKDKVLALYDQLQAEIRDVARRDEVRWGSDYRSFSRWSARTDLNTYDQEAAYVRQWISTRWDTLLREGPP